MWGGGGTHRAGDTEKNTRHAEPDNQKKESESEKEGRGMGRRRKKTCRDMQVDGEKERGGGERAYERNRNQETTGIETGKR